MANKSTFLDEKKADINKILQLIEQSMNIVVLSHKNPDGDAIGSAYGIIDYCRFKSKNVQGFIPFSYPSNLMFINYDEVIKSFDFDRHSDVIRKADLIVIVDLNAANRVGDMEQLVRDSKAKKVLIDHHLEPEDFCDFYYVDSSSASTGQLVYHIITGDDAYSLSREAAQAIYTAIMTDTGSFRFPQTNAEVHKIVVRLLESGADPVEAYDKVYNSFPISAIKLKGRVYENIETYLDDTVCISKITRQDYAETGAVEEQTEGIVESLLAVDTVKIAILLMETDDNQIRCSFRAKDRYNVRTMAVHFGGGGHAQAAGTRVKGKTIDELKNDIIEYARNHSFEV
jgi:phosphoesterase RecJ-like protein